MNHQWKLFSGLILVISLTIHQVHSNVTIATWPEGPVYPAATWLRVACRHDHAEQHRLQYRWTGGCNSTGETSLSVPDPLYDQFGWAVIWVQSTPATCLDSFQCSVFLHDNNGGDLTEIASEVFLLQNIAGVGMSLPGNVFLGSLQNNSVIIMDNQEQSRTREVICHSALKSNCPGEWLANPTSAPSDCAESGSEETTFNSVKLDLALVSAEGLIVCAVQDENREVQRLFLGVYTSVPELTLQPSFSLSSDSLALSCTSRGAPTTAILWTRETLLLEAGVDADISESSSLEGGSAQYTSTLMLDAEETGLFSCDAYTEWTLPSRADSGRKSTSSYFVVAPLSEMVQIVCTFPGEADVDYVQWMNVSEITGTHLVTEENRTAVMSLTVNEHEHGRTYTCRGSMDGDKKFVYKHFTIVARAPEYLSVKIHRPAHTSASGRPFSLKCSATSCNHTFEGSQTVLRWYKEGVPLDVEQHTTEVSADEEELCISLDIDALIKYNAGEYTCRGQLLSSGMMELFISEETVMVTATEIFAASDQMPASATATTTTSAPTRARPTESEEEQDEESLESSPSGEPANNNMLVTVFIGAVGAALLICIFLLTVVIIVLAVMHSRRKHSTQPNSESSSINFEEKQTDLKVED